MKKFIKVVSLSCLLLILFSCSSKEEKETKQSSTTSSTKTEVTSSSTSSTSNIVDEANPLSYTSTTGEVITIKTVTLSDGTTVSLSEEELIEAEEEGLLIISEDGHATIFEEDEREEVQVLKKEAEEKKAAVAASSKAKTTSTTKTPSTPKEVILPPPSSVTDLAISYKGGANKVELKWNEPTSSNFAYVMIKEDGKGEGVKVMKGTTSTLLTPSKKGNVSYLVTSYSDKDEEGKSVLSDSVITYMFSSMDVPLTGLIGGGNKVTVNVEGVNFITNKITPKDISLTCDEKSVVRKSEVKVIDDKHLQFDITIPKKIGEFLITVSNGVNKISNKLIVNPSPEILSVVEENGQPVAIIIGHSTAGIGIGMGLKEQSNKQWAVEGSTGVKTIFEDLVSIPTVLGTNSCLESEFEGDIDGKDNFTDLAKVDKKCLNPNGSVNMSYVKTTYPLFHSALVYGDTANVPAKYKDGWFIPSIKEMCDIYKNLKKLNNMLKDMGGDLLSDDFYWTSSQNDARPNNACAIRVQNGAIYKFYIKSNAIFARCVREFPEL